MALDLIPTGHRNEYLLWLRKVLKIETAVGERSYIQARKIILATGQDGTGRWWMPDRVEALPKHLRAHAADDIDFPSLEKKTVAVLGAGASAFDNAAEALDAGANPLHLFFYARRHTNDPTLALRHPSQVLAPPQRDERCLAMALHAARFGVARGLFVRFL